MTILEQLKVINERFSEFYDKYTLLCAETDAIEKKYIAREKEVIEKYQPLLGKIEATKRGLAAFCNVIKKYTSKSIVENYEKKCAIDIPKLYSIFDEVECQRFSNETAARDAADRMMDFINSNISYMDSKLADVKKSQDKELSLVKNTMNNELTSFSEKKIKLFSTVESYIEGDDFKNLSNSLERIYRDNKIADDFFSLLEKQKVVQQNKSEMLLGVKHISLNVPKFACEKIKDCLGGNFNENMKTIGCPVVFDTESFEDVTVEYTDKNKFAVKMGIQALILNFIRCFSIDFKVSLLDYIHYNADILGPIAILSKVKNGLIDKVEQNENCLRRAVSVLAGYYRNIENKIGTQSVYEYNSHCKREEYIPLRILIINKSETFRYSEREDISYLLNNAEKFGITVIKLLKKTEEPEKELPELHSIYSGNINKINITSDSKGNFYIESGKEWLRFEWPSSPAEIPSSFISKIQILLKPSDDVTKYFKRFAMHLPEKSTGKRKPIVIPFAVDDDDNIINCNFEEETFAAYMMGASGSGKSTLLHSIIAGILMNYHPDEVELWLLDFKMTEFKRYVNSRPPHVKYLLLEKSEDLVFDVIDKLTKLLDIRQRLFAQNQWYKLSDVPLSRNMPAIFVIIDEFAQMSQIVKETRGLGLANDYSVKLENLLAKGRALGLKFIFASQTYITGVAGLTETARKQIQMRFAMKNTIDEIRQTLNLASSESIPEINKYETLFLCRDETGSVKIGKYRNLWMDPGNGEIEQLVVKINAEMKPLPEGSVTDNLSYIDKNPVLIDGDCPKTYECMLESYKQFEANMDADEIDAGDVFIYPGVPCGFNLIKPFVLRNGSCENILLTGGQRDEKISVLLSILKSYEKTGNGIEIWAHKGSSAFKKYKNCFGKVCIISDLAEICGRISKMKSDIKNGNIAQGLVVCLGYELMISDLEILDSSDTAFNRETKPVCESKHKLPSLNEMIERVKKASVEEKKRMIAEYNAQVDAQKTFYRRDALYDARADIEWIIQRASVFGLHFLFYFEHAVDFTALRMDSKILRHKILSSMSTDDSFSILRGKKASEIENGVFLYSNGKEMYSMRPHIFRGIPLNGWLVDDNGQVVVRKQ